MRHPPKPHPPRWQAVPPPRACSVYMPTKRRTEFHRERRRQAKAVAALPVAARRVSCLAPSRSAYRVCQVARRPFSAVPATVSIVAASGSNCSACAVQKVARARTTSTAAACDRTTYSLITDQVDFGVKSVHEVHPQGHPLAVCCFRGWKCACAEWRQGQSVAITQNALSGQARP